MYKHLFRFFLLLLVASGVMYALHLFVLGNFLPQVPYELINFAYKFNIGFTLLFTTTIIVVSEKLKEQLGFIFLVSTFIKLGLFLFFIKFSDFELQKSDFLHFFLPYLACIGVEIFYVIKILNSTTPSKDS